MATYEYNGNGARAVKSTKLETTWFMYDGAGRMIAEIDGKDGAVLREYVYLGHQPIAVITRTVDKGASTGPGNGAGKGIGKPVEPPKGPGHGKGKPPITAPGVPSVPETPSPAQPGVYFFHTDQVGAPQAVTDIDGATVWQADWSPFGSVAIGQGKLTSHIRFPGQYFDEETGLHYNYYRHYDPTTGRYIESDPIGFLGGDINLFPYVFSNPISLYDNTGQKAKLISKPKNPYKPTTSYVPIVGCIVQIFEESSVAFTKGSHMRHCMTMCMSYKSCYFGGGVGLILGYGHEAYVNSADKQDTIDDIESNRIGFKCGENECADKTLYFNDCFWCCVRNKNNDRL